MLTTMLWHTTDRSHWPRNHYNRPPGRLQSPRTSEKQILPSPLEPKRQEPYLNIPYLKTYPHQRPSMDTGNNADRRRTKSTASPRCQVQTQGLGEENLAHHLVRSIGNPNLERSRPTSSLYVTANAGSKLPAIISRASLIPEPLRQARLTEAGNPYRLQGDQTPGAELSKSDGDGEERSLSLDAGFDVDEEDADDINRNPHYHRQAVVARRGLKRFRYEQS